MTLRETREKARELRRQGKSVRDIARLLDAAKSSVSGWVRDIELSDAQKQELSCKQHRWGAQNKGAQANKRKFRELREQYQDEGRCKAREGHTLHLMGCMLYWAEGAKHKNKLYFVNSDPNMLLLYMRFLRQELEVLDEDIGLFIHCHNVENVPRIEAYWTDLLDVPKSCLRKTQIKRGSDTRRNILENGVCGISIHSTRLAMHVYGAIQEYGGFEHAEWLF